MYAVTVTNKEQVLHEEYHNYLTPAIDSWKTIVRTFTDLPIHDHFIKQHKNYTLAEVKINNRTGLTTITIRGEADCPRTPTTKHLKEVFERIEK